MTRHVDSNEATVADSGLDHDQGFGLRMCAQAATGCALVALVGGVALSLLAVAPPRVVDDVQAGVGFAAGVGIAVISFGISSLVIAWADVVDRRMILPIGLLTYVLKILTIGLVVFTLAGRNWPGFEPLLWGIALGIATWVGIQAFSAYRWAVGR